MTFAFLFKASALILYVFISPNKINYQIQIPSQLISFKTNAIHLKRTTEQNYKPKDFLEKMMFPLTHRHFCSFNIFCYKNSIYNLIEVNTNFQPHFLQEYADRTSI